MARYDVFPNPEGVGWLLDVQADLLSGLNTRIVVPLLPTKDAPTPAERLNPVFSIGQSRALMVTQFMAAVPAALLRKPVANLEARHREIIDALDLLLIGF